MTDRERSLDTPVGPLTVVADDKGVVALSWRSGRHDQSAILDLAVEELNAYFAGTLRQFSVPIHLRTSPFQRDICAAISTIPFGETRTYGDLAKVLGVPAQAVGQGCGGNPVPIIIPCHRVLGSNGLGGFSGAGGVETKIALLKHEGAAGLLL